MEILDYMFGSDQDLTFRHMANAKAELNLHFRRYQLIYSYLGLYNYRLDHSL
jgi:hypothetical protein